jgi:hypothetical protein
MARFAMYSPNRNSVTETLEWAMIIWAKAVWARPEFLQQLRRIDGVAVCAVTGLLALNLFGFADIAAAQTPEPPSPAAAPLPAPPAAPPQGFIDAFGNWVQRGVSNVGAGFGAMVGAVGGQAGQAAKGAADAASTVAKSAADVARETATTVTTKVPTGVVRGSERCVLAPNGAPDCQAAAEVMCRAKGYNGGTSVDFVTNEKCPPRYRLSSRDTPEGVCTMEHFVTSALCQ